MGYCFIGNMVISCKTKDVELVQSANLIINEVLYDPSNAGLVGDANGDGVYGQNQDEFIELYNNGTGSLDMSGFKIRDFTIADTSKKTTFIFPKNSVLEAGKAVVVFGGGTPTGSFGGSTVYVTDSANGLNFANTGAKIYVTDSTDKVLLIFDSDFNSNNPNESYSRSPDILGSFLQHNTAFPGKFFSPGTKCDGSTF
jgi:hypothetical protein